MEFPQQNINQSESRIGDKKLSLELYVNTERSTRYLSLRKIGITP